MADRSDKKEKSAVHSGHRERLRQIVRDNGLEGLPDHLALEFLLFYAIPRRDVNPTAHALIDRFGSLSAVFDADLMDLTDVDGIGETAALLIRSIPQFQNKYALDKAKKRENFSSLKKAGKFLVEYYQTKTVESVAILLLDNSGGLITMHALDNGTVNSSPFTPRKVAELAFKYNASSVIIAHNHPFGTTEPSDDDLTVTRNLVDAFLELDLTVEAHFIVAGQKFRNIIPMLYDRSRFAPKYMIVDAAIRQSGHFVDDTHGEECTEPADPLPNENALPRK